MDLKTLIHNSEVRIVGYKKILENVGRDKTTEYPDWYKPLLREFFNAEQKFHKELIEEKTYSNQGLNPPFCYAF